MIQRVILIQNNCAQPLAMKVEFEMGIEGVILKLHDIHSHYCNRSHIIHIAIRITRIIIQMIESVW